ncbi:MAG: DUF3179 domain-containing (seleno)protein [Bacteroidota bacterium]|nr:DUF3179 domain-containing (seleno)protein [Bacteroidota bacterium]MDP4212666.1 DUF3179 domain-containing (seleno)protein [Bacteroidota bacterium]MDP4250611.1 DUF3179 domain-containing (seleno)protein [Bacteroidota bacterium]
MYRLPLITGIVLLFLTEITRVYFIMPFPGSQHADTICLAYFIGRNKWILRIIGVVLVTFPVYRIFTRDRLWKRILLATVLIFYGIIFFLFNFRFEADKMFYQPTHKNFATAVNNTMDSTRLVIGVEINGEAKAFPIQIIGYHHQVRDTIGHTPVMITYCTVCRTGRVYSPMINGHPESFRLVGMDHFNAMFEDQTTKSWWQQATGISIAGPLKGSSLKEIPSRQLTLAAWLRKYPDTKILQADTLYKEQYKDLADFDKGTIKGSLEKRDSASWKKKSWVIGVRMPDHDRAYDWNELVLHSIIQDSIAGYPIMILLEKDTASFYVFNRNVDGRTLWFTKTLNSPMLTDTNTRSLWNIEGLCVSGALKDKQMQSVPAYQEFWHSWKQFHPNTTQYQ